MGSGRRRNEPLPVLFSFTVFLGGRNGVSWKEILLTLLPPPPVPCLPVLCVFDKPISSSGSTIPGIVCLGSQVLHAVLLGDFVYYYAKAVGEGGAEMVLPTRELMV